MTKTDIEKNRNKDDLNAAIEGLTQFRHSFCMNVTECKKQDDLVFRCEECPFEGGDRRCAVKVFLNKYGT